MLLRSKRDRRVFERVEPVHDRYVCQQRQSSLQLWRFNFTVVAIAAHERLRLQLHPPAIVHWSADGWATVHCVRTEATGLGLHTFDFSQMCLRDATSFSRSCGRKPTVGRAVISS